MSRSNRIPFAVFSGAAFPVCAFWIITRGFHSLPPTSLSTLAAVSAASMILYLCSHLLRAIRLAVIGITIHNTSFRTLMLLNLSVAPWSMIAPLKLDELIRLNELHSLNRSWTKAATTIVIDRSMDGPVLLVFAAVLILHGENSLALYAGFFGVALAAVTAGFFGATQILTLIQGYVFMYHSKPRALRLLRHVHNMRLLAALGRETIATAAPILLVCTAGIWLLELSAVWLMLWSFPFLSHGLGDVASATLVGANSGWRSLLSDQQTHFPGAYISAVFATGLLLVWPAAIYLYCSRRRLEVRFARYTHRPVGIGAGQERT